MSSLHEFNKFTSQLLVEGGLMPMLFVGHGSPMNAIEDNEFSIRWERMGKEIPQLKAVLVISAHWLTSGTQVTAMPRPKTIHDFGGFPKELFDVEYPAPGAPGIADDVVDLVKYTQVGKDHDWGLDHGAWSVVRRMYPLADIPVLQLSIDYYQSPRYHYELAQELSRLREKGVLILGSGNMVHNLRMMQIKGGWENINEEYGFDWAHEMNSIFKEKIGNRDHKPLLDYEKLHPAAKLAIPTPDHYYPLLYVLGLQSGKDEVVFFNDKAIAGSLTMTSVLIG
jgi:4,5-DOPA dioxygenase extradiol